MPDQPHFALPFRFVNGRAVVNEQDSPDDVADCVVAIVSCPLGSRVEAPDFGAPDQTFAQTVDRQQLAAAIRHWEPRAHPQVARVLDPTDPYASSLQVNL